MLAWIRQLHDIERDGKKFDAGRRQALRGQESKPLFEGSKDSEGRFIQGITKRLIEQQTAVLPKSPIGDAVNCALNQWTGLTRYLDDGDLDIDNNEAEQALRGIAIGRKDWMFLGSNRGGRAATTYYTLTQSAKRHGLDPFAYLRDILPHTTAQPNTGLHRHKRKLVILVRLQNLRHE